MNAMDPPFFEKCENYKDMIVRIQNKIDNLKLSEVTTLAVICKTSEEEEKLYNSLDKKNRKCCYMLNKEDAEFHEGIIITNSYLAKGLEFKHVIVPEVTADKYFFERDRHILYIAGTCALHELYILYFGIKSLFLEWL